MYVLALHKNTNNQKKLLNSFDDSERIVIACAVCHVDTLKYVIEIASKLMDSEDLLQVLLKTDLCEDSILHF